MDDLSQDVLNSIKVIKQNPKLENAKVGFMGLSQGFWVAVKSAKNFNETAFIMGISGSVQSPVEQGRFINKRILESNGFTEKTIKLADSLQRLIDDAYRNKVNWEDTHEILVQHQEESWYKILGLGLQPRNHWNWRWYANLPFDYDPKKDILDLTDIVFFTANGLNDNIVDGQKTFDYFESINSIKSTNYLDPKGEHLLQITKNKWDTKYWESMEKWLINQSYIGRE